MRALLFLLIASPAFADGELDAHSTPLIAYQPAVVSVITPAVATTRVAPVYPHFALRMHIEGACHATITVPVEGESEVHINSCPKALTEAATEALQQWVWTPAIVDGSASESKLDVSLRFDVP
ncbi:MAG: outer membrane biosynthesis protein TonB [Kiritimatiellia bacterium]|jgi:outer membrane biosynthesis protein TonB